MEEEMLNTLAAILIRMTPEIFHELVDALSPLLEKKDKFMRKALEPELKIAITLCYLAIGDSYKSLMYSFSVSHNTICRIIPETCEVIFGEVMSFLSLVS
ncbi:hypothetical protein HOLleu_09811 [Holothuria leucospilota]|uniref:Uncharacterized protein n=1 Tax=Holothuria leucospilota TaxID=206669 RepID=A0A9Q1CDG4_HOLLE|nr:hypothetical protein HOLleu_09811 [Holothuria leucospilota]